MFLWLFCFSLMANSMFSTNDYNFMSRALVLARKGLFTTDPNPRVGCVIVRDGAIIAEGYHKYAGGDHAEIAALKSISYDVAGSTVYVTLEPCSHFGRTPPCAAALIDAKVSKVIVSMVDPNPDVAGQGIKFLQQAGIEVLSGLMESESRQLNPGFIKRMETGLPFVRCKMAMSLDGRTAMASGESKWITGAKSREDVHRLRARSSAMVTGVGTVLADDPQLTARLDDVDFQDALQPKRVVLDPCFKIPLTAKILSEAKEAIPTEVIVMAGLENIEKAKKLSQMGVSVIYLPSQNSTFDLQQVLKILAENGVNEVMVEAGAKLSGAFLSDRLLDEIIIYMAPHVMGNCAKGLFVLPDIDTMAQRIDLRVRDVVAIGDDWRFTLTLNEIDH